MIDYSSHRDHQKVDNASLEQYIVIDTPLNYKIHNLF